MRGIALCEEISPTINISTTLGVFILEDNEMAKYKDADELSKRLNDLKYPSSRALPRAVTYNSAIEDALQVVRDMPNADVVLRVERSRRPSDDLVKVVRCKDCKYKDKGQNECESWNMCKYRSWLYFPVNDDDYCSKGKRND